MFVFVDSMTLLTTLGIIHANNRLFSSNFVYKTSLTKTKEEETDFQTSILVCFGMLPEQHFLLLLGLTLLFTKMKHFS